MAFNCPDCKQIFLAQRGREVLVDDNPLRICYRCAKEYPAESVIGLWPVADELDLPERSYVWEHYLEE